MAERITRADCARLDARPDPLAGFAQRFAPGAPGTVYLDANSIGPMPADAPERVARVLDEGWRVARRRSWNETDWLRQPLDLGASIAHLLGVGATDVAVADSTTLNQHKLLHLALSIQAPRRTLVVEREVFASNRHAAQAVAASRGAQLLDLARIEDLAQVLASHEVAVVALSLVDYRHSTRLDLAAVTALAHAHGALVLWDLSHAAGAVELRMAEAGADLAVGCGYKYLCGGPGAPAWLYVHPRHQDAAWPSIAGWMGHADTFGFAPDYEPAPGVVRHLVGTPAVLANAAFSAAADLWREVDPRALDSRHRSLTNLLIALVEQECAQLGIEVASPRDQGARGGHVALRFTGSTDQDLEEDGGDAGALAQALVDAAVVVSSRKPDSLRLAPHPLVTSHLDIWEAVRRLRGLLVDGSWRDPRHRRTSV